MDSSSSKQQNTDALGSPAPGADDMLLSAAAAKVHDNKLSGDVAHQHNEDPRPKALDDGNDNNSHESSEDSARDPKMFSSVCEYLVEVIVSKQSAMDLDSDELKTPPFVPRSTGIAETCPDAPIKPKGRPRNINTDDMCRKLEY